MSQIRNEKMRKQTSELNHKEYFPRKLCWFFIC